jgi:hypothetical protein
MMVMAFHLGLVRLRESLGIDQNVQPGRVLLSARDVVEKYNAASALSLPNPTHHVS